jgi:hypothetical protein
VVVKGGAYVKVCFYPTSGNDYCQSEYKSTWLNGDWMAIATNVKDGTKFRLRFKNDGPYSGKIAF